MNNKGFTLVELLAVLVIIAVLGGIATYGVTRSLSISKEKTEDVFIKKLSDAIESYIELNSNNFKKVANSDVDFIKKKLTNETITVTAYEVQPTEGILSFSDIKNEGLVDKGNFTNPKSKKECFTDDDTNDDTNIIVYKDSDYVYYYYVDLSNSDCDITEGKVINTLPKELICNISGLKAKYNAAPNVDDDDKCTG